MLAGLQHLRISKQRHRLSTDLVNHDMLSSQGQPLQKTLCLAPPVKMIAIAVHDGPVDVTVAVLKSMLRRSGIVPNVIMWKERFPNLGGWAPSNTMNRSNACS